MLDLDSLKRANDTAAERELRQQAIPYYRARLAALEDARAVVGEHPDLDALIKRARESFVRASR